MSMNVAISQSPDDAVRSPVNTYEQKALVHGLRQFQQVFSTQFSQSVPINSSQTPVTLNLPPEVFNLSESYLCYQVSLPAVAANYIWTYADVPSEISHIQFYGANNQWICDLDNVQNYFKTVIKRETSLNDYDTLDPMNRLCASNTLVNSVPALRHGIAGAVSAPNPSNQNYTEPAYFNVGGLGAAVNYQVQLPLKLIKNTVFALNKNLYFNQITYMKIYFGPKEKICYMSTSNANPSSGTPVAYTGAGTISNVQLLLAVESNPDERRNLMERVKTHGLQLLIPYVQNFKNPNSGLNQSINIQLDIGQGRSLMKMFHSVFNNTEALDVAYDCNNCALNAGNLVGHKIANYWTQLNGARIQNLTLDCLSFGEAGASALPQSDYMTQKKSLYQSILDNSNSFQYNWSHMDDWTGFPTEYVQGDQSELISGVAMGGVPITWTMVANMATSTAYQHYTWAVFTKRLTISATAVLVE